MEDITLDDDDYDQRLLVMRGWDFASQSEIIFNPNELIYDLTDWDKYQAYKLKIKDLVGFPYDSLLICGKRIAVDEPIPLYDNPNSNGWNWVAYYPDYEADASLALESIATAGDPNSDLFLAKGNDGSFYYVDLAYCDLIMRPGDGYEMQLNGNQNVELIYPVDDPDQMPPPDKKGPGTPADIQHFEFKNRTGEFSANSNYRDSASK